MKPEFGLLCRGVTIFDLYLDGANQMIWSAITQLKQNLTQRLVLSAALGVRPLNMECFIKLVNSDVTEFYQNLTEQCAAVRRLSIVRRRRL
jgi:hypothetical protein